MGVNDELSSGEHAELRARLLTGAQRIRPVGKHRTAWVSGTVAVALVAAIAGGVGVSTTLSAPPVTGVVTPEPTPTRSIAPSPTNTPTPSATPVETPPEAEAAVAPSSPFTFDCRDVAADVAPFFGGTAPTTFSTIPVPAGNTLTPGPMQYSFAQAGALYCEYGDLSSAWAIVAIVPDAAGILEHQAGVLGGCERDFSCELVDGSFISVEGQQSAVDPSVGREEALRSTYDNVRSRLAGLPIDPARWQVPTGALVGSSCEDILPLERLSDVEERPLVLEGVHWAGWSVRSWMLFEHWKTDACAYYGRDADRAVDSPVLMTWLPGGEWAFEGAVSGETLAPAGAIGRDRAVLRCGLDDGYHACIVNVLVDGNWVRVRLPWVLEQPAAVSAATEIASAVIESVRG
jgi:hypothetical protein